MKRVSALVIAMLMALAMIAPACMAASNSDSGDALKIESSTPEKNATGVSVENLSVMITMNKEMDNLSDKAKESNAKALKLTDPKGKQIKIRAYYSKKYPNQVLVVSANNKNKTNRFESATKYTLTIGKNFKSSDGSVLGSDQKISFTTLNQAQSMKIYMLLMVLMMVGMIFFTTRSAKKAMEKTEETKDVYVPINPYKEAKRTGKSVEEVVAEEKKRKAKFEAAAAKKHAEEQALIEQIKKEEAKKYNKRVAGRRPISAAGSDYKVKLPTNEPKKNSKSTNPKGQSGKQKNSKKK